MNTSNITEKYLKGDAFQNRYRIHGTLKTLSPLHIGNGGMVDIKNRKPGKSGTEGDKPVLASAVIKDHRGKPVIPGSTIKGVIRHWLGSVLAGFGADWGQTHTNATKEMNALDQAEQIRIVRTEFGWVELLFGSSSHEGKIEAWDACCTTPTLPAPDKLLGWDSGSLTYIDTSVAIDPVTGTALEHLLYQYEVVPPGVEFEFDLTGQNLSRIELGLVLLALEGFNSTIYPIQIGARTGRGYGRVSMVLDAISYLDSAGLRPWIQGMVRSFGEAPRKDPAGYFALPVLSDAEKQVLLEEVRQALQAEMGR